MLHPHFISALAVALYHPWRCSRASGAVRGGKHISGRIHGPFWWCCPAKVSKARVGILPLYNIRPCRIVLHRIDALQAPGLGLIPLTGRDNLTVSSLQSEAEPPGLVDKDFKLWVLLFFITLHGLILNGREGRVSRHTLDTLLTGVLRGVHLRGGDDLVVVSDEVESPPAVVQVASPTPLQTAWQAIKVSKWSCRRR